VNALLVRSWCQAVNRERYDMNTRLDL